jgi:hypothetical protein
MTQELKQSKIVPTSEQIQNLRSFMKRLFSLPVKRSTLRELHGVLHRFSQGDEQFFKAIFESLFKGQMVSEIPPFNARVELDQLIREFSPQVRLARDVHDRGEFLGFLTSDVMNYQDRVLLSNFIRNVDGEELQFITDVATTLQILHHFTGRLREMGQTKPGKEVLADSKQSLKQLNAALAAVQDDLES